MFTVSNQKEEFISIQRVEWMQQPWLALAIIQGQSGPSLGMLESPLVGHVKVQTYHSYHSYIHVHVEVQL